LIEETSCKHAHNSPI